MVFKKINISLQEVIAEELNCDKRINKMAYLLDMFYLEHENMHKKDIKLYKSSLAVKEN